MQQTYIIGRWTSIAGLVLLLAAIASYLVTRFGVLMVAAIGAMLFFMGTFISMRTPGKLEAGS